MTVKIAIVGIRNYLANGEEDYSELFARLPIGSIVYLRKEPTGSQYPGSVSVWDDNNKQIGNISKTERRFIELEIPEGAMLPVKISGHSAEHNCMFITAENTKGVKTPFIREIKLQEGETVFALTEYDEKIQQLTSLMKTKLKMLKDGMESDTASLIATTKEYVHYCCASLDGDTSFSRADILMEFSILMESYPELREYYSCIYEQHKDIGRKYNDVKTRAFIEQYNRIKNSVLNSAGKVRSQMDDYLEKLKFANGGRLSTDVLDAEIQNLSALLAGEMMKSYEKSTETPETFATALYSLNYSMRGIYRLYTRRIKLDYLKAMVGTDEANGIPTTFNEGSARLLLTKIWDPDKIKVLGFGYKDFYLIQSKKNENDLLHWFEDNGTQLESNLEKIGYNWCYVFEIAMPVGNSQYHPNIYMAIGKDISQFTVEEFFKDEMKSAPDGISYEFCEDSISTMNLTRFYTATESLLKDKIVSVKDTSNQDINNYKIERHIVRHLKDETPSAVSSPEDNMAELMKRIEDAIQQQTAAIDRQTEVLKATAKVPSMNDNNGIVTGGNLEARISLTDDQTKIIADRLAANGNTKLLE